MEGIPPRVVGIVPSKALFPRLSVSNDWNMLRSSGSRVVNEHDDMWSSIRLVRFVISAMLKANPSALELTSKYVRDVDSNRVGKPLSVIAFVETSNISIIVSKPNRSSTKNRQERYEKRIDGQNVELIYQNLTNKGTGLTKFLKVVHICLR